jgi:hypothetical protein
MRSGIRVSLVAACLAGFADGGRARAEPSEPALRIRAAFVLNFLKFTEWPAEAVGKEGDDLGLVVLGDGPLAAALRESLDGKTVQGLTVRVRLHRDAAEWQKDPKPCHAVFVTSRAGAARLDLQAALAGRPVATIAEQPGFCAGGGMLNLFEQAGKIRFEANPEAVGAARLKLRADLLKLAVIVKTEAK